ncbi:hypothetical protein AGMMS50267_04560 [Spirochaetia bacterium]|nr:hypothetical protein AGMMS50267_04560 [Spirochaetia bacterium]
MSRKTNTLLFILAATIFNILVTIISFLVILVLFIKFLAPLLPESAAQWGFPAIFIGAIALSFVLYRVVLKQLMKRVDVDKYFDPLFGRPRRSPKRKHD